VPLDIDCYSNAQPRSGAEEVPDDTAGRHPQQHHLRAVRMVGKPFGGKEPQNVSRGPTIIYISNNRRRE